eukprot:gene5853-3921_t
MALQPRQGAPPSRGDADTLAAFLDPIAAGERGRLTDELCSLGRAGAEGVMERGPLTGARNPTALRRAHTRA